MVDVGFSWLALGLGHVFLAETNNENVSGFRSR